MPPIGPVLVEPVFFSFSRPPKLVQGLPKPPILKVTAQKNVFYHQYPRGHKTGARPPNLAKTGQKCGPGPVSGEKIIRNHLKVFLTFITFFLLPNGIAKHEKPFVHPIPLGFGHPFSPRRAVLQNHPGWNLAATTPWAAIPGSKFPDVSLVAGCCGIFRTRIGSATPQAGKFFGKKSPPSSRVLGEIPTHAWGPLAAILTTKILVENFSVWPHFFFNWSLRTALFLTKKKLEQNRVWLCALGVSVF